MSKFWLYLGVLLVCSGIGTAFGIILLVLYFWNDIKQTIQQNSNQFQQNSVQTPDDPKFYDDDTIERMK